MGEAGVAATTVRRGARVAAGLAVLLLVGACAGRDYLPVDGEGGRTALPPKASADAPPPAPPPVQPSPVPTPAADQCGAAPLQYLVGKPRTEIPVPVDPGRRRVVCTTCPMTQDVRPDRQTILYDEATHAVVSVRCG